MTKGTIKEAADSFGATRVQPQALAQLSSHLDAGQVMVKGALRTVAPLLTVLREAGHLSHDVSTREGAPLAGLAFTV